MTQGTCTWHREPRLCPPHGRPSRDRAGPLPSGGRGSGSPGSCAAETHTHSEICCPVQCHWSRAKQRAHQACRQAHTRTGPFCLPSSAWAWFYKIPTLGAGKEEKVPVPPQEGLRNLLGKGLLMQVKHTALKSLQGKVFVWLGPEHQGSWKNNPALLLPAAWCWTPDSELHAQMKDQHVSPSRGGKRRLKMRSWCERLL